MGATIGIDVGDAVAEAPLHPWNDGYEPPAVDGERPLRRLTRAQVASYRADGYVLVDDLFDPVRLAAVAAEIDPHERRINELLHQLGGRLSVAAADALTVTLHLSTFAPGCRALAYDPVVADLCHDLIGPDVRLYWDQAVYKLPHNPDVVPWHQDNGYAYVDPQDYLTIWVPLVDATLDNGTVWVVPGGHRRGTLVHEDDGLGQRCLPESTEGAVAVEVPAGSAVAFSSLTPHRTGPNVTGEVRSAYILQYAPDGAAVLEGDPRSAPSRRVPASDPLRQHPIVVGGAPVAPPPRADA
ncbi:MAG: phytanoyl-CoA dioxygenase family protein [Actinobacteria bacterium]|nr:phytanoyl-CoA dioxygenase family protein [Actinomycetota bacterium]